MDDENIGITPSTHIQILYICICTRSVYECIYYVYIYNYAYIVYV